MHLSHRRDLQIKKRVNNSVGKWAKDLRQISRWPVSMWRKHVQPHHPWGNCKLKPQWDTALDQIGLSSDKDTQHPETIFHHQRESNLVYTHHRTVGHYLLKWNQCLPLWPSNFTARYLPKGTERVCPQKTRMRVFMTALFIIAPHWKQLPCPLTR